MFEWLNEDSRIFLSRGYLLERETPEQRIKDIADAAEQYLGIEGYSEKFYDYMSKGYFSLSSPVWANFGRPRGLPISCFGSVCPDSLGGIFETLTEMGVMSKNGGGTSGYFGHVRPRGSKIRMSGTSEGVVNFLRLFDTGIDVAKQAEVRRGSFAAYLPIDHGDIGEFLDIRHDGNRIQNILTGITVEDWWMNDMISGDDEKRKIWAKVLDSRSKVGLPYIFFKDNANKNKPDCYEDCEILASNLCVTGDQRVVSDRGYLTAKELFEQGGELTLFDNDKVVKSSEMKLVEESADVYKITLENGMSHTITSYHKVKTLNIKNNPEIVECKNLKIGDRVCIQTNKGLFGKKDMRDEAFLLGLYQSDGTQHKDIIMLDVWENDFDLLDEIQDKFNKIHFGYGCDTYEINTPHAGLITRGRSPATFHDCSIPSGEVKKKRLASKTLKKALNFEKGYIPDWIWESNEETQWEYVRGLLIADGTVNVSTSKGEPIQIAYADINFEFLQELQLIFNNLGLQSSIRLLRKGGKNLLPDGKGGVKEYNTKDCFRLIIGNKNNALKIEKNTGFLSRKNVKLEDRVYRNNTKKAYKINSIEYVGKKPVYCVKVDSEEHLWTCNGVITHNCSEISLPSDEKTSFVCCLSAINLVYIDEILETDAIQTLHFFLDAVMTEFINKSEHIKHMERARNFAINHRALGLGVLGYHTYLQNKMIPFDSQESFDETNRIFSSIEEKCNEANETAAKMWGEAPVAEGYGRRNTTSTTLMPTKSSSFILGQVSQSIEPILSNYYTRDLAKIKFEFKNPNLEKLLESKGKNLKKTWDSIKKHDGSVQHLDFLSEKEKGVFKTFSEINQYTLLQLAADRQKYIDQSQSINLMIHPDTETKEINKAIIDFWKAGGISLYYHKSVNAAQEFNRKLMTCESCSL